MEFGKGKFQLSPDSYPFEQAFIKKTKNAPTKVLLGLPQWSIPEWKGVFYTHDTPIKKFLAEYSKRLNCVEVSSTFYADIGEHTLKNWVEAVDENFRFLPKWPRNITHEQGLHNCAEESLEFVRKMHILGQNLGATLLQLPPTFSTAYTRALYNFLRILPSDFPIAIEFRHKSWFQGPRFYPKLETYMAKENISSICTDTPGRRDVFHLSFTGDHNVVRYLSDEDSEMDAARLQIWKNWLDETSAGSNFYFILHQSDNKLAPHLIPLFSPKHAQKIEDLLPPSQQSLL